ncbi:MAG TPA: response regulator [Terriglobales bacterium]|nr:response regulator [Terriglobales bacterium]
MTDLNQPQPMQPHRLLLVDDYAEVRVTMELVLRQHGFEVVSASTVRDALRLCCDQEFDVLLCDLQMPRPGDGFTVSSAMRHCNPKCLNIIYSGYPAISAATADILQQADEVLVKPLVIPDLLALLDERLAKGRSHKPRALPGDAAESVATVLRREAANTITDWLALVKGSAELTRSAITDAERAQHLPQLFKDLFLRLKNLEKLDTSQSDPRHARSHGIRRREQGYLPAQIVEESRILQVAIFKMLRSNLQHLNYSHLLASVMAIADEVDMQLKEALDSYANDKPRPPESTVQGEKLDLTG